MDTPDGVLVAYQTGDIDYPGIVVERKADKRGEPDIALSLTEYIPGGEVLNSYDSAQADEAHHQTGEVPEERQRFRAMAARKFPLVLLPAAGPMRQMIRSAAVGPFT